MARGGKREGSGRKPKSDEQRLIERLTPLEDIVHEKLKQAIEAGEQWAIKLFFEYLYGKAKERMDVTSKGDKISLNFILPKDE